MCKFESSQKDESRWQSTDSSKAYRNASAFKCSFYNSYKQVRIFSEMFATANYTGSIVKTFSQSF